MNIFCPTGIGLKFSISNNHLVMPQGQIFYDSGRSAAVYNSDKNNIFVAAFSKADEVVTISLL